MGDSATGTNHSTIDGHGHIGIRILDFHTPLHGHSNLTTFFLAEMVFLGLGEIDGHAADALPEPA